MNQVEAKVKFLSLEPLLERIISEIIRDAEALQKVGINWIICGQQTPIRPSTQPKIEWIRDIVEAADRAGIPVFLKENLYPLIHYERRVKDRGWLKYYEIGENLRQELPRCGY